MSTPKKISDYMRHLQRRSAKSRRAALSDGENKQRMSALAKARWAKTKSVAPGRPDV